MIKLAALVFLSLCTVGCYPMQHYITEVRPLNQAELAIFRDVEACIGLENTSPPRIGEGRMISCPLGMPCCLKESGYHLCESGEGLCGVSGAQYSPINIVVLPGKCRSVIRHEFVHAILSENHIPDNGHSLPFFKTCGQ